MAWGLTGLDAKRLRLVLGLFFLALAAPTGVLVIKAYDQLKWETFHQYRIQAEELGGRIDRHLTDLINAEEARSFADYGFLLVAGDPTVGFLQRSPLSELPVRTAIPGLLGWFQVDAEGAFSTPLLPGDIGGTADYRIPEEELGPRESLATGIRRVLTRNRLVEMPGEAGEVESKHQVSADQAPRDQDWASRADESISLADEEAEPVPAQAAFDRLQIRDEAPAKERKQAKTKALGRVEDLELDLSYQRGVSPQSSAPRAQRERGLRKERSALPQPMDRPAAAPATLQAGVGQERQSAPELRVRIFESELDPFALSLLDSGHFVLFRKVWRDEQRYIQGALIDQEPFLRGLIDEPFRGTALSRMSDLVVAYRGAVLGAYSSQAGRDYLTSAGELTGALLHRMRLSAPAGDLELIFSISHLPAGPGAAVVGWLAAILGLVLTGGFYLLYRLGLRQIALTRQQQDFVSAVSHELKTPLTSIRMYGEMLREGWAPEERKGTYYDFICTESERLSRLINNVLQLARLTRNELAVELKPMEVDTLIDAIRPKIVSQAEQAGFLIRMDCAGTEGAMVQVDEDFLTQILINLVDNAIKFSRDSERREVLIGCVRERGGELRISVRDFGPGIPAGQMKKIFRLFYRAGDELTRETVGTGIGLALVRQLALAMYGRVDLVNREPGAEFRVFLPTEKTAGKS